MCTKIYSSAKDVGLVDNLLTFQANYNQMHFIDTKIYLVSGLSCRSESRNLSLVALEHNFDIVIIAIVNPYVTFEHVFPVL